MANFPLVLAIAPGLMSYASANGFTMDHKVCDLQGRPCSHPSPGY